MVLAGGTMKHSNLPVISQVSLVHASDSVRTVSGSSASHATPSTSHTAMFPAVSANHRMSKPPVRVVAQSPANLHNPHQHNVYASNVQAGIPTRCHVPTMSVQPMAGRSNDDYPNMSQSRTSSDYGTKTTSHEMLHRVRAVRRQVADEETELRRLREIEHETSLLREKNAGREKELERESARLVEEQTVLRNATLRVQSLARQLEEMYKRRQTAAAAALVEHRKLQQQQTARSAELSRQSAAPLPSDVVRPRASVEPFQVVTSTSASSVNAARDTDYNKSGDFIDGPISDGKIPSEPSYMAPSPSSKDTQREDVSPSPPKDPHPSPPSPPVHPPVAEMSKMSIERKPPMSTFAVPTAFEQKINSSTMTRDSPSSYSIERPTSFGDSLDESKLRSGKTDLVSLRPDSLKATKRRSWAASENTSMTEAETIHRLLEEQRRGRNHFIPQLPTPIEETVGACDDKMEEVPVSSGDNMAADDEEVNSTTGGTTTEEETSSSNGRSSDDEKDMEIEVAEERRRVVGILREPNVKMNKGRIEFDPLALLLDAALEGELDLVRSSAAKLTDVSQANDEGITALHNAICAGHYEIVRFLIEHDADVNAQDSDGWTPLHCAASCNNLPMVRQLVEGGGCVLASTLSDMETPVEKCEEEEDGYDGCLKYLVAAHSSTGSLNARKVYAAYAYEAAFEDEMSFDAGDELTVLSKDDVDKHWWTCRNSKGETGLVPRTYLALYPALKYRKRLNFVMFDLPLDSSNNHD